MDNSAAAYGKQHGSSSKQTGQSQEDKYCMIPLTWSENRSQQSYAENTSYAEPVLESDILTPITTTQDSATHSL